MKFFLTLYVVGGMLWFFYSKSQGYVTSTTQKVIWPWTFYTQLRDKGSVAT